MPLYDQELTERQKSNTGYYNEAVVYFNNRYLVSKKFFKNRVVTFFKLIDYTSKLVYDCYVNGDQKWAVQKKNDNGG